MKARSKNEHSMVIVVVAGSFAAIITSLILILGLTSLMLKGSLNVSVAGVAVFTVRVLSVFVGCLIAGSMYKQKGALVIGSVVVIYLAVIISIGIVAFDGLVENFALGLLSALLGGVFALILRLIPKKRAFRSVRHIK